MSIYVSAIRNLLYYRKDLFNFLVTSGLYDRYHDSVVILQRLKELLDNGQVEELISKMDWIDKLRAFSIDYVVTYLLFKNPNNKELASRVAEIINYQIGTLINYINASIEVAITKARGETTRVLLVSRILSYFSDLLSMFDEIILGDPDEIITYLLFRANYLSSLVESRSSIAKKLRELGETIEEAAEEIRREQQQQTESPISSTLGSIASDLKYEYIKSSAGTNLPVFRRIFNKDEINLLGLLLQRGAVYPKGSISLEVLSRELNADKKDILRIINAIWDKCKDFDMPLLIRTDRVTDESGKEEVFIYIDSDSFRKAVNKLSKAHPDLVDLFVKLGYGI